MRAIDGSSQLAGHGAPDPGEWLERLASSGAGHDAAIEELHTLLLRAARFEINRRRSGLPQLRGDDHEDLAQQSADDALVAILGKLGDFRGASRFTTWAYKFALYEAAAKLRKRSWQEREIPLDSDGWALIADRRSGPDRDLEASELLGALRDAINSDLTPHQREVLVALALNEVPIDVLADRLNTTRGALYKTLHDARRKLRAALAAGGMELEVRKNRKQT
jgi:RNA polymerase sigma-70 factor (ECF subfamily)